MSTVVDGVLVVCSSARRDAVRRDLQSKVITRAHPGPSPGRPRRVITSEPAELISATRLGRVLVKELAARQAWTHLPRVGMRTRIWQRPGAVWPVR
jgi:predicted nucleic acid-binding Zn ribbon protein